MYFNIVVYRILDKNKLTLPTGSRMNNSPKHNDERKQPYDFILQNFKNQELFLI